AIGILQHEYKQLYDQQIRSIRAARAALQGFRSIEIYTEKDIWDGSLVLDFRLRDWTYQQLRHLMKALLIAKACGDAEREARVAKRLDQVQAEAGSIHAHCFRGKRGAVVQGLRDTLSTVEAA
ncbi:MAG: hypothetical protein V3V01_10785, partial [Acidimicrobiales bacterium]